LGLDNAGVSQETIEIARRALEQFNQDFVSTEELFFDLLARDVVFDNSNAALDGAVYHGHEGMATSCRCCGGCGSSNRAKLRSSSLSARIG
jgi:glycogen debranching enzyme